MVPIVHEATYDDQSDSRRPSGNKVQHCFTAEAQKPGGNSV